MIEGKVWGTTEEILKLPTCSVHRLEVKQGGYCSEHVHRAKFNQFFVESGVLSVKVWNTHKPALRGSQTLQATHSKLGSMPDQTILRAGDSLVVEPGTPHVFEGIAPTVVYESYWVELTEDIERRTHGGVHKGVEADDG